MKNIGFLTLLITAMLLLILAFPAAATGPKTPAAPVPAAAPAPAAPAAMPPHPHIAEALEAMQAAKRHLEAAEGDFRGHRGKALEHLSQAIHQAEVCMHER